MKIYEDDADLVAVLEDHVAEGLERGEAVILILTPEHWAATRERLQATQDVVQSAIQNGHLVVLDAAETLSKLLVDGKPRSCAFDAVVGASIARLLVGHRRVRAYGEMVDILVQQGEVQAAFELEDLWNGLMSRESMTLLCSYRMDLLDPRSNHPLEGVCARHNQTRLPRGRPHLDAAVERAFLAVLGDQGPRLLPLVQATIHRNPHLGPAEKTIIWMRRNLPSKTPHFLLQAKRHLAPA